MVNLCIESEIIIAVMWEEPADKFTTMKSRKKYIY